MNDVKEICALALDVPAPAARTSDEALARAKRASRHWQRLIVASSSAIVLALVGSVALLRSPVASIAVVDGQPAARTVVAAPAVVVPPAAPSWQDAQRNGGRVSATLAIAVPAGLTVAPAHRSHTQTWVALPQPDQAGAYFATTPLIVSFGPRQGLLAADIVRDNVAAPNDPCDAATTARLDKYIGHTTGCHMVTIGGVAIRLSSGVADQLGHFNLAVRMLADGYVTVVSAQGRYSLDPSNASLPPDAVNRHPAGDPAAPKLSEPALSLDAVGALAADPLLLP